MDSNRDQIQYIINPETERKIKVGGPTWRRLTTKYYTYNDGSFTNELIPDSRTYRTNKVWDENTNSMKTARKAKHPTPRKRVSDPKGERKYLIVGSKSWNDRYLEYEWNGREFTKERDEPLPEFANTVGKRREVRRMSYYDLFDRKISAGRLSDVIDSSLGYALTYYHTLNGKMVKEWMNVKRTKKDFRTRYDIDEEKVWVHLPDGKSEEEVEPLQLLVNEKNKDEFKEVAKKYIMNGLRDYAQCFVMIMVYNLMKIPPALFFLFHYNTAIAPRKEPPPPCKNPGADGSRVWVSGRRPAGPGGATVPDRGQYELYQHRMAGLPWSGNAHHGGRGDAGIRGVNEFYVPCRLAASSSGMPLAGLVPVRPAGLDAAGLLVEPVGTL